MIFSSTESTGQWVDTHGPFGSDVYCFSANSTNLFAGTSGNGVYRSTNDGIDWTEINSGMTTKSVNALAISGTNIIAGTVLSGIFISTDNGTNWTAISSGLTNAPILSLFVKETYLFAGTRGNGIFLSTNNGTSWTAANSGLNITGRDVVVGNFAVCGKSLFVGTSDGLFCSTNNGSNWMLVNSDNTSKSISALVTIDTNLFAGTSYGVFLSTNNGTNWTSINNGLTTTYVWDLAVSGTNLFVGIMSEYGLNNGGIFLSTNNGANWTAVNSGLINTDVLSLIVKGTNLFAGIYGGVVWPNQLVGGVWKRSLSEMITSVETIPVIQTINFNLYQNYPNPFNPSTTISFSLLSKSFVTLKVFDLRGREVSTIIKEELSAGIYSRTWNAINISSGIYFYRLQAGSFTETKKLILLR